MFIFDIYLKNNALKLLKYLNINKLKYFFDFDLTFKTDYFFLLAHAKINFFSMLACKIIYDKIENEIQFISMVMHMLYY